MPEFRGAALAIQSIRHSDEFILSGPYETGKTFAALYLLDALMREYPGARAAIVRKVRADMDSTVMETWRGVVALHGGVEVYGGERPEHYTYTNGSKVFVGGLDKPGKTLSGERDFIYVNQAEELEQEDWEVLSTRTTGRSGRAIDGDGVPIGLLFGDCNPGPPGHWILSRAALRLLTTTHKDNPTLYNADGSLTPRGKQTMGKLDALTGHQRSRGRDGLWVAATGLVYDEVWSDGPPDGNVRGDEADYHAGDGDILWIADDGYSGAVNPATGLYTATSHPRVFLLAQVRPTGQICVFAEHYATQILPERQIEEVRALGYPDPEYAIVDSSAAELRGRLVDADISSFGGTHPVDEGIKVMRRFLAPDANGVRMLLVHKRCRQLRAEMVSYRYGDNEKPIKQFDHGPDCVRMLVWKHRHD